MSRDETTPGDDAAPPEDSGSAESRAEKRFRRRVGIALATLAMLGAWISVLATNAGTNESAAARQATRMAVESQTADVIAKGVNNGLDQIETEIELLPTRSVFQAADGFAESLGATPDPALAEERLATARADLESSLGGKESRPDQLQIEARRLSLEQAVLVEQRVEWNAYASQYETVLTVLAIAIFLLGFTLVLGRKLRPPVAVPGIILALICAGWAVQIYVKPKTEVSETAINATAAGDYAVSEGRAEDAIEDFTAALEATPGYFEALAGRSSAILLEANPDLFNTVAFTDTSDEVTSAATTDVEAAIESGGDTDATVLAVAAVAALADGDWDLAAERLEAGIELNELAAELYLWRSAVAVAQDDEEAAQSWLEDAVTRFGDLDDRKGRQLAAQYLTLLEYVAHRQPDQADLAGRLTDAGVIAITKNAVDRSLDPEAAPDAALTGATASYDDGDTFVKLDVTGVPEGTAIATVGYELPAEGAAWVQPPELFYAGPANEGQGLTLSTPRSCVAIEYRFDLYVEGQFRNSVEGPGAAPTC